MTLSGQRYAHRWRGLPKNWGYAMMTDDEIVDLFDRTFLTLAELASISGRSVEYLKHLLLS